MRSFKEKFGQSSMDYLAEIRTNEAKRLMEAGQPLKDIALLAGFKDQHYFSSQFKKQVGLPPRTYIANRKCKTAAYSWPNKPSWTPSLILLWFSEMPSMTKRTRS
nr:helix-turn-helix domain-containing protein [Paenibacillus xylanivorans]